MCYSRSVRRQSIDARVRRIPRTRSERPAGSEPTTSRRAEAWVALGTMGAAVVGLFRHQVARLRRESAAGLAAARRIRPRPVTVPRDRAPALERFGAFRVKRSFAHL